LGSINAQIAAGLTQLAVAILAIDIAIARPTATAALIEANRHGQYPCSGTPCRCFSIAAE
jgi:hypothetical protein